MANEIAAWESELGGNVATDATIVRAIACPGANPALVYLASLAPTGRLTMRGSLARVATMCGHALEGMPWASLRYEHLSAIRARLVESGLAPATCNRYLAALRGTLRAAWRMGQMDAEAYTRAIDVPGVTGSRLPAGRAVAPGELSALLRACADGTPSGARDGAIIALAYAGGLRRAELAGLRLEDVHQDADARLATIRLTGKRAKERLVHVNNGALEHLRDWLAIRGESPGTLFLRIRKGGRVCGGVGISPSAIRNVLQLRARQAGVAHLSPHDLRRTFVSDLLDAGTDISTVAAMAGHASVTTTQRYDRRGEEAARRASRTLQVPHWGGGRAMTGPDGGGV